MAHGPAKGPDSEIDDLRRIARANAERADKYKARMGRARQGERVYVASSWRNIHQPAVVEAIRERGHLAYDFRHPARDGGGFAWSEIDTEWESWTTEQYAATLRHPVAKRGFSRDESAMRWATSAVLVLPCGRSAHMEAGWFMGRDKPVIVYTPEPQEPELMYLLGGPRTKITDDVGLVLRWLDGLGQRVWFGHGHEVG